MDFQLKKIMTEYPGFFLTVKIALRTAYAKAKEQMSPDMRNDRLCSQRRGYYVLTNAEHELKRAFERAGYAGVIVKDAPNANYTNYHIEIHTPFGVFMVAKVSSSKSVPRRTYFRQKFLDQIFMPVVFPEYEVFSDKCVPLYIITHVPSYSYNEPKAISVGRLSNDQMYWSCCEPIDNLCHGRTEEIIEEQKKPAVQEEIAKKQNRIQLKEA